MIMLDADAMLTWDQIMPGAGLIHVARRHRSANSALPQHHHDFAECFWVETGSIWHLIDGQRQHLQRGDLILVRPETAHGFRTARDAACVSANIAFPGPVLRELEERYGAESWYWRDAAVPAVHRLDDQGLARLAHWLDELALGGDRTDLDAFLLDLQRLIRGRPGPTAPAAVPAWLEDGVRRFCDEGHYDVGIPALHACCGRSGSHVNRSIRQHYDCSCSELVNGLRLQEAGRMLALSDESIAGIALEVGFDNLGYFYRCFRTRFGTTPRRYRLRQRRVV